MEEPSRVPGQRKGFSTFAVLAVVAVAVTLMVALTYQQRFSQQMYTLSEARLEADLAVENALVKLARANLPDDKGPRGDLKKDGSAQFGVGPNGTGTLDRNQLVVDVDSKGPDPSAPADFVFGDTDKMDASKRVGSFKFNPSSSNPNLRVFNHRGYQGAGLAAFPYAAFAPAGEITVDSVNAWSNATEADLEKLGVTATQAFSGLPAWVGADSKVEVKGDFPYGEIHTKSTSSAALKLSGQGRAVAYQGSFPYEGFGNSLKADLDNAFTALQNNAVDKTGLIVGVLQFEHIYDMVTGRRSPADLPNFLSMQQASEWLFFVLPSIKTKGLALDLQMHTPLMADGSAEFFELAEKIGLTSYTATQPADPKTQKLQDLQNEIAFLEWKLSHDPKDANPYPANGDNGYPPAYVVDWFKTLNLPFPWAKDKTAPADGQVDLGQVPPPSLKPGDITNPNGGNPTGDWKNSGGSPVRPDNPSDPSAKDVGQEGWIAAHDALKVKLDAITAEVKTLDATEKAKENAIKNLQSQLAQLTVSNATSTVIDAKKAEIDKAQKDLDQWRIDTGIVAKRAQRDKLGSDLDKFAHEIEAQKNLAQAKRDEMQKVLNEYDASNLKGTAPIQGPTRRLEMILGKIKVPGPDPGPLLDPRKGMKFFSYYELLKSLWNAFKSVINDAIDTFPMVSIRVNLGFVKFTIKIPAIWKIPEWLINVGKSMVQALLKLVIHKISIVHLGGLPIQPFPNPNPGSGWDALPATAKEFQINTWTVPPGRTCRLAKNGNGQTVSMVVTGDMWVQRGATMVVDGDLTIQPNTKPEGYLLGKQLPGWEVRRLLEPRGRIILEEGATLLVGGNLVAKEVVTCGPVGQVHGITSGVLCKGNVSLAKGTSGGMTLQDVALGIGETKAAKDIHNMFQDFFPNFVKLTMYPVGPGDQIFSGPFHIRKTYFGRHPVIIRYILPFGPIYPTFEIGDAVAGQNVNNTIFAVLTVPFTLHLNMTLGENLMTRSDLWVAMFQGFDHIPVFPKVTPGKTVKDAAAGFRNFIDIFSDLASITPDDLKNGVVKGFNKALKEFPTKGAATMLVPVALSILDPTGVSGVIVGKVLDEILGLENIFKNNFALPREMGMNVFEGFMMPLARAYAGFVNAATSMLKADAGLIESPGVLIYAGGNLLLGGDEKNSAAGFFVAGKDIDVNCSYVAGSLVSLEGTIRAHNLLYYPQFSEISLFMPYRFRDKNGNALGGSKISDVAEFWETVVGTNGFKYGDRLEPGASVRIPSRAIPLQTAGGWGRN